MRDSILVTPAEAAAITDRGATWAELQLARAAYLSYRQAHPEYTNPADAHTMALTAAYMAGKMNGIRNRRKAGK